MIIDKINSLEQLTIQEKAIVDYINQNLKAIIDFNVSELAKASFTSPSTVIRLSQKLGYKGYSELRSAYTLEYSNMIKQNTLKRKPFEKDTSIDEVMQILPMSYLKTVDYARTMLSKNKIIRITNLLKQADRIEIYGTGINYDLGKMMAYRFETVNKDCFVYNSPHWEHLKYLEMNHIHTIAILLSHTGKNPIIIDAAKRLKNSQIKTISISCNSIDTLKQLTDENIQIIDYHSELELKTTMFMIGVQFVLDVCISSILIQNIDKVENIVSKVDVEREKWLK